MNITQLVDALRKAQSALDSVAQPRSLQAEALADVDDALAAYDAQRATPTADKLAAHALAAALQNTLDAYGDGMDSETLTEGRAALAAYDAAGGEK